MIKRYSTTWVYVRRHMYEFSPDINNIFNTPGQDADFPRMPWTTESLDDTVNTISGGKKKKWGNLSMLDVTPYDEHFVQVLCVSIGSLRQINKP